MCNFVVDNKIIYFLLDTIFKASCPYSVIPEIISQLYKYASIMSDTKTSLNYSKALNGNAFSIY